jgi:hypothetical protein
MNTMYTGYTKTEYAKPATKAQLVALRDLLLEYGDKNAAAAVDNVIDILGQKAGEITKSQEPTPNLEIDEIERDWKQQVDELRGGA